MATPTPDEVKDAIAQNAVGPKAVTGDSGSRTQHDISAQIEAQKFLAEQDARSSRKLPIRFARANPGSTV